MQTARHSIGSTLRLKQWLNAQQVPWQISLNSFGMYTCRHEDTPSDCCEAADRGQKSRDWITWQTGSLWSVTTAAADDVRTCSRWRHRRRQRTTTSSFRDASCWRKERGWCKSKNLTHVIRTFDRLTQFLAYFHPSAEIFISKLQIGQAHVWLNKTPRNPYWGEAVLWMHRLCSHLPSRDARYE